MPSYTLVFEAIVYIQQNKEILNSHSKCQPGFRMKLTHITLNHTMNRLCKLTIRFLLNLTIFKKNNIADYQQIIVTLKPIATLQHQLPVNVLWQCQTGCPIQH